MPNLQTRIAAVTLVERYLHSAALLFGWHPSADTRRTELTPRQRVER